MLEKPSSESKSAETFIFSKKNPLPSKAFIKHLPVAVAVFDKDLNYIMTSDQWAQETNVDINDIIGKNLYEVVVDIPEKWKKIHQRALNGEYLKAEEDVFNRKDGSREWWRWRFLPGMHQRRQ